MTAPALLSEAGPIRDASRRLVRELGFMRGTLAGTDLPPSAVHALVEIGAKGSLTAAALCEILGLEKSSVSRMVRKLIEKGELAEAASGRDGRVKPLSLTAQGRATLAAIDRFAEDQVVAALTKLQPGTRRTVLDGLAAYAAALAQSRAGGGSGQAAAMVANATVSGAADMDEARTAELAGPAFVPRPGARLRGKICMVTGGGTGIGRAAALRFALEGAAGVVIGGRRVAAGEAAAASVRDAGAECAFIETDVTREADVAGLVKAALHRFGRLDAAFNNAGFQERRAPLAEQDDATYGRVFDTNIRALFLCLRHQIPAMLATGGGAIVNNTSVSGIRNPNPGLSLYAASKAAAIALTRSAAMEYAPSGVRINAIAPGRVVTDMMLGSGIADMTQVAAGLPLRRMGRPEEAASAVCWLLSDDASYVVGHVLCTDGGFLAA